MEKIKLYNGTEYSIIRVDQSGDNLSFTVSGVTSFAVLRKQLTPSNLETIEVLTEGGATCAVFEGYQLTGKFDIEEMETGLEITVHLKKEDELLKRIRLLEAEVAALKEPVQG